MELVLVVVVLLDLEDAVHELRILLELGPGLVGLFDRDRDVRPALDRQPACLASGLAAATFAAEQLRGGFAGDPAACAELLLGPLGAFAAELLGFLSRFRPEHLHDVGTLLRRQPGRSRRSRRGSSRKQDVLALQPGKTGFAVTASKFLFGLIDHFASLFLSHDWDVPLFVVRSGGGCLRSVSVNAGKPREPGGSFILGRLRTRIVAM